jgi:hypothetical protein
MLSASSHVGRTNRIDNGLKAASHQPRPSSDAIRRPIPRHVHQAYRYTTRAGRQTPVPTLVTRRVPTTSTAVSTTIAAPATR